MPHAKPWVDTEMGLTVNWITKSKASFVLPINSRIKQKRKKDCFSFFIYFVFFFCFVFIPRLICKVFRPGIDVKHLLLVTNIFSNGRSLQRKLYQKVKCEIFLIYIGNSCQMALLCLFLFFNASIYGRSSQTKIWNMFTFRERKKMDIYIYTWSGKNLNTNIIISHSLRRKEYIYIYTYAITLLYIQQRFPDLQQQRQRFEIFKNYLNTYIGVLRKGKFNFSANNAFNSLQKANHCDW